MGSTSSTSAVYAWCVATANVINKANVGLNVTVVQSGAALDDLQKLKAGAFDFALSIDIPLCHADVPGHLKGQPWQDVRILFIRNVTADRIYVRYGAGIKTFTDLGERKYFPGIPGAASTACIMKFTEILKANIGFMPGTLRDGIKAFKAKKIVGRRKRAPLWANRCLPHRGQYHRTDHGHWFYQERCRKK